MLRLSILILLASSAFASSALHAKSAKEPDLIVYSYDTFMAKGGLGQKIVPMFEAKCACTLKVISVGDAAQILTRVQLDEKRKKPTAHAVVGVDGPTWQLVRQYAEEWGTWSPNGYAEIDAAHKREGGFLPFDFGHMTFMADEKRLRELGLPKPKSLKELLEDKWRRQIIFQDPRTSTPGLSFLLFFSQLDSKTFPERVKQLRKQWLTLAPGWDAAYGIFLKEEAPLVWSYSTSQAYHEEDGDKPSKKRQRRYEALMLDEGAVLQVEGAAIIKGAFKSDKQRALAKEFLSFMISKEVQSLVPKYNWMFPVVAKTPLPESFRNVPNPKKVVTVVEDRLEIDAIMRSWMRALN